MFATTRAITHARAPRAVNATANSRRRTGPVVVARAAETTKEQKVRPISIRFDPRQGRTDRARANGWMDDARARAPTRGTRRTRRGCAEKNNVRRVARVRSIVRSFDRRRSFVRSSRGTRARARRARARARTRSTSTDDGRATTTRRRTRRRARKTSDDIRARERAIDDGGIGRARARCIDGSHAMG